MLYFPNSFSNTFSVQFSKIANHFKTPSLSWLKFSEKGFCLFCSLLYPRFKLGPSTWQLFCKYLLSKWMNPQRVRKHCTNAISKLFPQKFLFCIPDGITGTCPLSLLPRLVPNSDMKEGIKTIPKEKICKTAKWLSEEALQIAMKRREAKGKGQK